MRLSLSILLIIFALTCNAKVGILVAHYGSSEEDTRHKTIDLITADIRNAFPTIDVAEAYISPIVREKLTKKSIATLSPAEAIDKLHREGVDTLIVQSSTIIDGAEMADVRNAAESRRDLFKVVRIGRPLCFSPDDCLDVVNVMASQTVELGTAIVFAGHGNNLPSTATYAQLDYMLHAAGKPNIHVSTIEGYPTPQTTIRELQEHPEITLVELRPLLLVCGNHTKTDIAEDFAGQINAAGYTTNVIFQGFAEYPEIRRIYVERIREMLNK